TNQLDEGNKRRGDFTITLTSNTTAVPHAVRTNQTQHSDSTVTTTMEEDSTKTASGDTGDYAYVGDTRTTTEARGTQTNGPPTVARQSTGMTEVSSTGFGNALWGDYVRFEDVLGNRSTSTETTVNQGSTFTVTNNTDGAGSGIATGNSVSGDYTRFQVSSGTA